MKIDNDDACWVANVGAGVHQMNLTVYHSPGGWRWLAHDLATGARSGDAASTAEHAKRAAEEFLRKHVPGDEPVLWNMAFVRRHNG